MPLANLTYCDLFCGCGGFSIGFKEAGFRPLGGIDVDKMALESYKLNITPRAWNKDVTDVFGMDFVRFIGERPDIVLASPPCEGFSDANAGRIDDAWERLYSPPGSLTIEAIDWICDLDPRIGFIIENVPAIGDGPLAIYIADELARIGYKKVYFNMIRAERVGSASKRPRFFISNLKFEEPPEIPAYNRFKVVSPVLGHDAGVDDDKRAAVQSDTGDESIDEAEFEHCLVTVQDVLGDLPDPSDLHDFIDHEPAPLSSEREKEILRLKWGNSLMQFEGSNGSMKNTWIRLHPFDIAPILMGKSTFIHPFVDRQLSIREYARLQGFPDSYLFCGGFTEKKNQIGEAVSPLVARYIARRILEGYPR
ncbi:MAG: DNA cytosine methyltransferase [Candidatus Lokiarchaeota archaeon]|nr:DNA cytosine methyltransferase [Candidatus Lokiarchaeota archaeon]